MSLSAGTLLGPYEIVSRIGAGGMSEVFKAHDTRIRRDVAIKILPPTLAKFADRMHRFEQESRAAGALNHPNLLTIFDVGTSEGRPYIVTELLEGQTLRMHLRENGTAVKLSIRKAVDYGIQIANGLAAAHERGIVHRDLKPENLFVTRDGRVKILDFGVAKLRSSDEFTLSDEDTMEQDTSPGTVIGTVGYMSPEQVRGQNVDGRSDIFSFGTLMYEMVSGEHPFRGDSPADTMSAILREEPPELSSKNANVTPGLERVIRHCMEKSPEQRFQSARDLAFHLDMLSSGSGTMPTVETPILPRRTFLLGAAAIILAALAFLAGWMLRAREQRQIASSYRFQQLTHQAGVEISPAISPDGESFVFVSNGDIYLQRITGRNAINLTKRCEQPDSQPAFSPDGSMIAYRSECDGGGIFVMGATGEAARRITGSCFNPSWSPDAKQIVCGTESINFTPTSRGQRSELWIVEVDTGQRRLLLQADGVQPSWSPNGSRIAYWGMAGESARRDIWTIDPNAKEPAKSVVRVTDDAAVDWNPAWSPDGQYLYFGSDRGGAMNLWRIRINEKSGNTRGDARQLIRWAEAKGVNPRDKRYTVIGSLLTVLLADNLGLEDAATIATIIASDRLYADTQLLDDLIVRFQIPQSITNEDGITGVSRTTGPTIRWRGTTDEEELQSFLKEPPDLIDIAFLSQAILRSRSVCKIEIPSIGRTGTGFLITNNLVLTNYHVLKDSIDEDLEANAQNLVLHFGYYTGEGSTQLFALDAHDPVVAQSSVDQLDFALLRVNQAILTAHDLGPVVPSRALPSKGSGLHILQHPQGGTMKLGLSSNGVTGVYEDRGLIQYVTRASNGSSGAPCFNDKWEVVAIHHAERSQAFGSIREGILFQFVYSQIHSYL